MTDHEKLHRLASKAAVEVVEYAEPETVAGIIAATMDASVSSVALDVEPEVWLEMMPRLRREKALSCAAILVGALERKGYAIVKRIKP